MPGKDNMDARFEAMVVYRVKRFPRDEKVEALVHRLSDFPRGAAGDDTHFAHKLGAKRQRPQLFTLSALPALSSGALSSGEAEDHLIQPSGDRQRALVPDLRSTVRTERLHILKPKMICNADVVSHLRVLIQREMGRIQRQIALHEGPQALVEGAHEALLPVPQYPVMDKKHLGALLDGAAERSQGRIHGKCHFGHFLCLACHLEAVSARIDLFE